MLEGRGRQLNKHNPRRDIEDQLRDDGTADVDNGDMAVVKELGGTSATHNESVAPTPSQEGLHTVESLTTLVQQKTALFEQWGYRDVRVNPHQVVQSYEKHLYALAITAQDIASNRTVNGWITLALANDGTASYRCSFTNEVIDTVRLPSDVDVSEWLEAASKQSKVVKSRPLWLYPELFHLPAEEVIPKNAKITIIGDPYQSCDREGITIIEYEYVDELVPPVLYAYLKHETPYVEGWLEDIYSEEVLALDRMYEGLLSSRTNPYKFFVERCFALAQSIAQRMMTGHTDHPIQRRQLQVLQAFGKQLIDGSWSMADTKRLLGIDTCDHYIKRQYVQYRRYDPSLSQQDYYERYGASLEEEWPTLEHDLHEWFELKESALSQMGNPERWNEFLQHWEGYLNDLPITYLQQRVDNLDKIIAQIRHWLSVLPTAKSPERVTTGLYALERLYHQLRFYHNPDNPETAGLENFRVEQATDRDFGSFGYFIPGYVVSLRTKRTIEEAVSRCAQLMTYSDGFFPAVLKEEQRLKAAGVDFDQETLFTYFSTLERAYARQHFFQKRTRHAAALHGFFPYRIPGIEPQDRILALNSVTMHGWNQLNEKGFYDELKTSLQYLRQKGKYILGPINQHAYFSGYQENSFDASGLTQALQRLAEEGLIAYEFHFGRREYENVYDDSYNDTDDLSTADFDPTILPDGESAHCLVITKLTP